MFYLTTHSTHFNTVIWRQTIHLAREKAVVALAVRGLLYEQTG